MYIVSYEKVHNALWIYIHLILLWFSEFQNIGGRGGYISENLLKVWGILFECIHIHFPNLTIMWLMPFVAKFTLLRDLWGKILVSHFHFYKVNAIEEKWHLIISMPKHPQTLIWYCNIQMHHIEFDIFTCFFDKLQWIDLIYVPIENRMRCPLYLGQAPFFPTRYAQDMIMVTNVTFK